MKLERFCCLGRICCFIRDPVKHLRKNLTQKTRPRRFAWRYGRGAQGRRGRLTQNPNLRSTAPGCGINSDQSLADERELIPTVVGSTSRESGQEQL
jgi:hypothetical protein